MQVHNGDTKILGLGDRLWIWGGVLGLVACESASCYLLYQSGAKAYVFVLIAVLIMLAFFTGCLIAIQTLGRLSVSLSSDAIKASCSSGEGQLVMNLSHVERIECVRTPTQQKYGKGKPYSYSLQIMGCWGNLMLGEEIEEAVAERAIEQLRLHCPKAVIFTLKDAEEAKTFLT